MESKYIPLYRKYRPKTFYDLIGQENIVHALENAVKMNKIAHAYLFCGPRGTGKTSSARILAKSLNCKEGPTLTPCGKCPACLDIMNSIPVDVIEIDAASNRTVEDTQAILEKIQYVPVNGRFKIYVIDEVHMLSNHAFNALLKTLEEPPANVIFILATTEPHKVLDTIISRCQRFDFRRITTDDIVKRLEYISEQENIKITKGALRSIAKNSQGGMRDSLALLDQISVLGADKEINEDDVNELLGRISYDRLYDIAECILAADNMQSVKLIDDVYSKGNEPVQILNNLIQYFRDLMILKNCSDKELIYSLTRINEEIYDKNKAIADKFTVSEIIQILDRLSYYILQVKEASNKYLWLEICIVELINYKNLPSAENLLKRIEALENRTSAGSSAQSAPKAAIEPAAVYIPPKAPEVQKTAPAAPETPVFQKEEKPAAYNEPAPVQKNVNSDLHNLWVSVVQSISSLTAKAYFQKAQPVEISEDRILIAFQNDMFVKMADKNKKQALADAAASYLGIKNPNIEVITAADIPEGAAQKSVKTPEPVQKQPEIKEDIQKQEEEEYHSYIEAKNEPPAPEPPKQINTSGTQAEMVKELFDGKFIE